MVLSSALHLAELVLTVSEVIAGAAAGRDVPVVAFLPSWVRTTVESGAHIQFTHLICMQLICVQLISESR